MSFFRQFGRFGASTALVDQRDGRVSYPELALRVEEWKGKLSSLGPYHGKPLLLGIEIEARAGMITADLAALAHGQAVILATPGSLISGPAQRRRGGRRPACGDDGPLAARPARSGALVAAECALPESDATQCHFRFAFGP